MNERIKELAIQADAIILGSVQSKSAGLLIEKWEQKFAELLVKECIEVGNRAWLNDNSTFPTFPSEQIKEHFGVD